MIISPEYRDFVRAYAKLFKKKAEKLGCYIKLKRAKRHIKRIGREVQFNREAHIKRRFLQDLAKLENPGQNEESQRLSNLLLAKNIDNAMMRERYRNPR